MKTSGCNLDVVEVHEGAGGCLDKDGEVGHMTPEFGFPVFPLFPCQLLQPVQKVHQVREPSACVAVELAGGEDGMSRGTGREREKVI